MSDSKPGAGTQIVYWLIIIAVFPCVGFFIGWFVGMSRSPVVGTLLPILFGVLGAMGFGAIEKRAMQKRLHDCIEEFNDKAAAAQLKTALPEIQRPSLAAPAAWSFGTILFCVACYFGANAGMNAKQLKYPPLADMIGNAQVTTKERGLLFKIRWTLMDRRVSEDEARAFFDGPVATCLGMPKELETERFVELDNLLKSAAAGPTTARNIATEDPSIPAPVGELRS